MEKENILSRRTELAALESVKVRCWNTAMQVRVGEEAVDGGASTLGRTQLPWV